MRRNILRVRRARAALAAGAMAGAGLLSAAPAFAVTTCQGATVTISGTTTANTITGTSGDDVIDGGGGNDVINGGGGNDTICGGAGNDTIDGGPGNDSSDGGTGLDAASFTSSPAGVTASLAAGTATGDGSDTFALIENLTGSSFNDNLTGNSAAREGGLHP